MRRSSRHHASEEEGVNFWPGLSDMILAALVLALLLFFGASAVDLITRGRLAQQVKQQEDSIKEVEHMKSRLADILDQLIKAQTSLLTTDEQRRQAEAERDKLRKELETTKSSDALLDTLQKRLTDLENLLAALQIDKTNLAAALASEQKKHDKPPNITLSEAQNYAFESGRAELTPEFQTKLRENVLPQMMDAFSKYPVEIIEIVGHTDRHVVPARVSNFDQKVDDVLERRISISGLVYGSNGDLGLMRAIAIRTFLQDHIKKIVAGELLPEKLTPEKRADLAKVEIRPYSAAQTAPANRGLDPEADKQNRRIEIRFTKLKGE